MPIIPLFVFCCLGSRYVDVAQAETTLAIFGDFGAGGARATLVSEMIRDGGNPGDPWNTDYIFTTGDNQYGQIDVGHDHWDRHIGKLYGSYMKARQNPTGIHLGQTSAVQRFFPAVGNHDASPTGTGQDGSDGGILPGYLDYFHDDPAAPAGRLPAGVHNLQESYYDVELPIEGGAGTVQVFVLDSNSFRVNPTSRSAQTAWIENGLKNSTATWKFVTMHHPAHNSTSRGDDYQMQLPFQQWGAHAVFAGHVHSYERFSVTDAIQQDMPYFSTGMGGLSVAHKFSNSSPNTKHQFGGTSAANGSLRVRVTDETATFDFLSIADGATGANGGELIDTFTLDQNNLPQAPQGNRLVHAGSEWHYLDDGSDQETAWKDFAFDPLQAGWTTGNAQFGFGNAYETTTTSPTLDPAAKPITSYFRKTFEVDSEKLARFEKLALGLVRDAGAAVYLNGVEIRRDNLPSNAAYNTRATQSVSINGKFQKVSTDLAIGSLLRLGTNVLAVEVHQSNSVTPSLGFDLTLDGGLIDFGKVTPGVTTQFSEASPGFTAFGRDAAETELEWGQTVLAFAGDSEVRNTLLGQALADNQLVINNRSIKLVSEPIDVRDFRDVQVAIDWRGFTSDSTGFEAGDQMTFGVQTSLDGINFSEINWQSILAGNAFLQTGQVVGSVNGAFQTSQSPLGFVGDAVGSMKVYVRAQNNAGSEYMFIDSILVSGLLTADFNGDNAVDASDLAILETHFGASSGASFASGDSDRDGDVDGRDFLNWQRQFRSGLASQTAVQAVPEPSNCVLLLSCAILARAYTDRRASTILRRHRGAY